MSDVSNINSAIQPAFSYAPATATPSARAATELYAQGEVGRAGPANLNRFRNAVLRSVEQSSFSLARTRAIRAEIEAGTFETRARIDGTVDRLLDVIA